MTECITVKPDPKTSLVLSRMLSSIEKEYGALAFLSLCRRFSFLMKYNFLFQGTNLYRTVQDKPLKDQLPLGTGVLVNLRRFIRH